MADSQDSIIAEVDEQGRLVIPAALAEKYGLTPGSRLRLEDREGAVVLHRPATHLNKVYIEPTDLCNLTCSMCMRQTWDETMGRMSEATFEAILEGLKSFSPVPAVFFGGLGEPLFHPKTVEWVGRVKQLGGRVELITNGTPLTEKRSRQLIDAGLDVLWVSIDGATPQSFADVRLGDHLQEIIDNVWTFQSLRKLGHMPKPEIGIAFVAMKRNIHELPEILQIGKQLKAAYVSVSNVMPYTAEMDGERLYAKTLNNITYMNSPWVRKLSLPKMDLDETTREAFFQALNSGYAVNFAGNPLSGSNDVCNFIENGTISIRWDGSASPCWPLMHNHTSYLHRKLHVTRRHVIGSVQERSLKNLWLDPEYVEYREKVMRFGFAPCTFCGGCDLSEANEEDCVGNEFPACGSCLWSQGVIYCP
jgi:AbrB family looped-hinge helix DNA binding protein